MFASGAAVTRRSSPIESATAREARCTLTVTVPAVVSTVWILPTQVKWSVGCHQGSETGQAIAGAHTTSAATATRATISSFLMSFLLESGSGVLPCNARSVPCPSVGTHLAQWC